MNLTVRCTLSGPGVVCNFSDESLRSATCLLRFRWAHQMASVYLEKEQDRSGFLQQLMHNLSEGMVLKRESVPV